MNLFIIFFIKSFVPESLLFVLFLVVFVVILVDESPGDANEVSLIELLLICFLPSTSSSDDDDDDESLQFRVIFNKDLPIMLLPLSRFLFPFSFDLTVAVDFFLCFLLLLSGDESSELLDELADFLSFFSLICSCGVAFKLFVDFLPPVDLSESDDDESLDTGSCLTLVCKRNDNLE